MNSPAGWPVSDDLHYANEYVIFTGARITRHVMPTLALDQLAVRPVPVSHPAWPGHGVYALSDIPNATEIGYYTGVCRPGSFAPENPYVFALQPASLDLVIDAQCMGNITRFINDPRGMNKLPNLEAEDASYHAGAHSVRAVLLRASRDIAAGEELLYPYEQQDKSNYWEVFGTTTVDLTQEPDANWVRIKRERVEQDDTTDPSPSPPPPGGAPTFFEAFTMLAARIARFDPLQCEAVVNAGSKDKLLSASRQVLADYASKIQEAFQDMPDELLHYEIPAGYKRCTGPCQKVKRVTTDNFRSDCTKKTGLRGKCKACESVKTAGKKKRMASPE